MAPSMSERLKQTSAEAENQVQIENPIIDIDPEISPETHGDNGNGNGMSEIEQVQDKNKREQDGKKFLKEIYGPDLSVEQQVVEGIIGCNDIDHILEKTDLRFFENSYIRHIAEALLEHRKKYKTPPGLTFVEEVKKRLNHLDETEINLIDAKLLNIKDKLEILYKENQYNETSYKDTIIKYFKSRFIKINACDVIELSEKGLTEQAEKKRQETLDFDDDNKPKLKILYTHEQEIKDYDFVVAHLITSNICFGIVGPTGSDKSLFIQDMALSCYMGLNTCHGFKTKQGWILFILGEGHDDIIRRDRAWKIDRKIDKEDWNKATIAYTSQPVPITNEKAFKELCELIDKEIERHGCPPLMIIIDTVSRNIGSGSEMNQLMKEYGNKSNQLRVIYGCSIGSIYHSVVGDKRGKYASQLEADNDVTYYMGPSKQGENIKVFEVLNPPRGFPPIKPFYVSSEIIEIGGIDSMTGEPVTSVVACNPDIEYSAETENNDKTRKKRKPKKELTMVLFKELLEKNNNKPVPFDLFKSKLSQYEICKGKDCKFMKDGKCEYMSNPPAIDKKTEKKLCITRYSRSKFLKEPGKELGLVRDTENNLRLLGRSI